jgi:CHAD domain-containing protein
LGAEFRRLGIELAWLAAARCWWPSASGSEPEDAAPEATVAASAVPEDAATAEPADAVAPAEMVASAASNEARAAAEPAGALREFAAAVLRRRLRKLVGADEDIAALDPPALHGLRLRAKRLRYAAEIFTPLYSAKAARRFLHRLSDLQDHLGRMNDVATAASLLADLGVPGGRHAYAGGLVLGVAGAGTSELRPQIGRAWERFRRVDPFWE